MTSVTVGVFGAKPEERQELCKLIAKKDSEADLSYYSTVAGGKVVSVVEPSFFPDKPQVACFAAALSDYCIFIAREPSKAFAETLVLLDLMKKDKGCLVTHGGLEEFIKGTVVEGYDVVSTLEEAKTKVFELQGDESLKDKPFFAVVDGSFEVKGVGSVALGVIKQGTLKQYDELTAEPGGFAVGVRSIQVHDADVKQAAAGDRFGIGFKGATIDQVKRGTVLLHGKEETREASFNVHLSKFAEPIEPNTVLHAVVGLEFVNCHVSAEVKPGESRQAEIVFEKPVYVGALPVMLLNLNAKKSRIIGVGRV